MEGGLPTRVKLPSIFRVYGKSMSALSSFHFQHVWQKRKYETVMDVRFLVSENRLLAFHQTAVPGVSRKLWEAHRAETKEIEG